MQGSSSAGHGGGRRAPDAQLDPFTTRRLARERGARGADATARMRCVSSGYLSGGCACQASVPADVAAAAWQRERRDGMQGDGFFQFTWEDEEWLGFGVEGKGVRGVYCPAHSAQRAERSFMQLLSRSSSGEETLSAA